MSKNSRVGYSQAIFNLSSWKFLGFEIFLFSIWAGAYFDSIYAFFFFLIGLFAVFLNKTTLLIASLGISFAWAVLGAMFARGINFFHHEIFNSLENFIYIFSSPLAQVTAILIFIFSYFYHVSVAQLLRDIFIPILPKSSKFIRYKSNR